MRCYVAAKVLDDDAYARARHHVVRHISPAVLGDAEGLAEIAEDVVNLVRRHSAVGVFGTARSPEGVQPDGNLADVLDDVVADDGIEIGRAVTVDAELGVHVRAVEQDA